MRDVERDAPITCASAAHNWTSAFIILLDIIMTVDLKMKTNQRNLRLRWTFTVDSNINIRIRNQNRKLR